MIYADIGWLWHG